jgi:hypothetical protein
MDSDDEDERSETFEGEYEIHGQINTVTLEIMCIDGLPVRKVNEYNGVRGPMNMNL